MWSAEYDVNHRILDKEFEDIISLGNDCSVAWAMKDRGLRKESMPFDFIATTPSEVLYWLRNDFDGFFEGGNVNRRFMHFRDESSRREKLTKRIVRFQERIHSSSELLLIWTQTPEVMSTNRRYETYCGFMNILGWFEHAGISFSAIALTFGCKMEDKDNILNMQFKNYGVDMCYGNQSSAERLQQEMMKVFSTIKRTRSSVG